MSRGHEQRLRVYSWVVLLSALLTVACGSPVPSRHAVLGDWKFIGEKGVEFAELKFFPNGKCRFTQAGQKLRFCGWDPDGEKRVRLRFGLLLPTGRATGAVAGDELIVEFGNPNSSTTWIRAGSTKEQSIKAYVRGQALMEAGDFEKGIAEWTSAADRGDATVQNNLAWLFATAKDPKLHNGKQAVAYAEKAVAQERSSTYLDTLAAALARDGQFERAVRIQEEALSLVAKENPVDQVESQRFTDRLALYKSGKAYTEP